MNESRRVPSLDMLTAALGGRRINTLLWGLWVLAATVAHYVQDMSTSETVQPRTKVAFAMCVLGLVFFAGILLRALTSKERRAALISRQSDLPSVTITFRILIWVVALLALGAALAPSIIR